MEFKMPLIIKKESEDFDAPKDTKPSSQNLQVKSETGCHFETVLIKPGTVTVREFQEIVQSAVEIPLETCRLCAGDITGDKFYIYDPGDTPLYIKINLSLPIQVVLDDGLPSYICRECRKNLESTYKFTLDVAGAENILKERFRRFVSRPSGTYENRGNHENEVQGCENEIQGYENEIQGYENEIQGYETGIQEYENEIQRYENEIQGYKNTLYISDFHRKNQDVFNVNNNYEGNPRENPEMENRGNDEFHTFGNEIYEEENPNENKLEESEEVRFICHLCGKTFKFEGMLKSHAKMHASCENTTIFTCEFCGQVFRTFLSGNEHISSAHPQNNVKIKQSVANLMYKCEYCERNFQNCHKLIYHKLNRHKVRIFSCGICHVKFTSYHRRNDHRDVHGSNLELEFLRSHFVCEFCEKTYPSFDYLNTHKKLKHKTPASTYKCNKCRKVFSSPSTASNHYKTKHKNNYFMCPERKCNGQFDTEAALKVHVEESHSSPVICFVCGKIFSSKTALKLHKTNQHEPGHVCEICGLTFNKTGSFETHRDEHGKSTSNCSICKKEFRFKYELLKHTRTRHSGNFRLLVDLNEDVV